MIRNALLAFLSGVGRGAVAAAQGILGPIERSVAWMPARLLVRFVASALEAAVEYALYGAGWVLWAVDWVLRGPALLGEAAGMLGPGRLLVHGVLLCDPLADPRAALAGAGRILGEAAGLLEGHGIEVVAVGWSIRAVDRGSVRARVPSCGPRALLERPFTWLSFRAPERAPVLTVFFAPDLRPLAGCAFPGADWILVSLETDGTTVVHELGHLADLWTHADDRDNVMTDRAGGTHDRITPRQRALLRTCRFVGAAPREDARDRNRREPAG